MKKQVKKIRLKIVMEKYTATVRNMYYACKDFFSNGLV